MPQVDFTLEDLKKVFATMDDLDRRFVSEREFTRQLVREEVREEVNAGIMTFVEDIFEPAITSLQEQIGELREQWTKK